MKIEDFKYLEEGQLPVLVLGIYQDPQYLREFKFKPEREFLNIAHQTGGLSCQQVYISGTILAVPDRIKVRMFEMDKKYLDSNIGMWGKPTLDDLQEYRETLKKFGVDCNNSHQFFAEGIYPVDINFLKSMTDEKFPEDLDELVVWGKQSDRFAGIIGRWGLSILGANCD